MAAGKQVHDLPDIRGIDTFTGHTMHSAAWDHDDDFAGKRVAVIGTGARAVQIVPELVQTAGFVKVFQRTPRWVLPRIDPALPAELQTLLTKFPVAQHVLRATLHRGHRWAAAGPERPALTNRLVAEIGKAHLRRQVKDPWLRRQLTPDHPPGHRPTLVSSAYYPALQRDNCKLICWPIATISPAGIRTSDGIEHHLDVIVFATPSPSLRSRTRATSTA